MIKLRDVKVRPQYRTWVRHRLIVLEYASTHAPAAIELIRHARQELGYGAARTRLWLQRVHGIRLAMGTIQRVFRDIGMPRLRRTRKREPRQMRLFEKAEPGESVQVD